MDYDAEHPYRHLIDHPVEEIDRFLLYHGVDAERVGIVGGPQYEDGELLALYNVRVVDGRYEGRISADFTYRFDPAIDLDIEEIYPAQVAAIKRAFPEADVQCYVPEAWAE